MVWWKIWGKLGDPVIVDGRQRWTVVGDGSRGSRGSLWAVVLLLLLLLLLLVMLVIVGVRSVAFTLISQFYAFRHVITKLLELKKITVLKWGQFIPSFFFDPLKDSLMGRDSSVDIATRYGLDGPAIESRWGARFSAPAQTGSGAYPASCTMGTGSFPGLKRPGHGADHTPPV